MLGVLQATLDHTGPPAIAMRVGVPHYAMNDRNPKSMMALAAPPRARHRSVTHHGQLGSDVAEWEERLNAAVAEDSDPRLREPTEERYDSQTEMQVSSGEDLAAELERFLREQRGDT